MLINWLHPSWLFSEKKIYSETHTRLMKAPPRADLGTVKHHEAAISAMPSHDKDKPFLSLYTTSPFLHVTTDKVEAVCVDTITLDFDKIETWKVLIKLKQEIPTVDDPETTFAVQLQDGQYRENIAFSGLKPHTKEIPVYFNELHALGVLYELRYLSPTKVILPCAPNKDLPLYERWRDTLTGDSLPAITVPEGLRREF